MPDTGLRPDTWYFDVVRVQAHDRFNVALAEGVIDGPERVLMWVAACLTFLLNSSRTAMHNGRDTKPQPEQITFVRLALVNPLIHYRRSISRWTRLQ